MASRQDPGAPGGPHGTRPLRPAAPTDQAADLARAAAEVRAAASPPGGEPPDGQAREVHYHKHDYHMGDHSTAAPGSNLTQHHTSGSPLGEVGYSFMRPVRGWLQYVNDHKWPRRLLIGCAVLGAAGLVAWGVSAFGGGGSGPAASSTGSGSTTAGQGTSSGSQVTPQSGAKNGFPSTDTTSTSTSTTSTEPAGTPAQFTINGNNGPGSYDQYSGYIDSTSGITQTDVFIKFVLPNGQDARFDARGSAQCDPNNVYTAQLAEVTWIYCPGVLPGSIFLNALWDNPAPGNTTVLVSANNGTGRKTSSGIPTPPPDAKWINLGPIDISSQSGVNGPGS